MKNRIHIIFAGVTAFAITHDEDNLQSIRMERGQLVFDEKKGRFVPGRTLCASPRNN